MRVLVTGGTGFIGSNLALALRDLGHDVWMTGTSGEQDLPGLRDRTLPREFWRLDWSTLGPIDVVFHLAAINDTTLTDRGEMFRVNVDAALQLFGEAVAHGCRRIVYASSCSVYGNLPAPYREDGPVRPLNVYAESKLALDERARAFARAHQGVAVVGLRYSNIYGPRERHKGKRATMITQLAEQMLRGNPKLFKWGEQKRDYLPVSEAVRATLLAAAATESGVVNCGSGTATSFNELVGVLNEVLGLHRTPEYINNPHNGRYQDYTECDMTRARQAIGFVPAVGIRDGIRAYAESGMLLPPVEGVEASSSSRPLAGQPESVLPFFHDTHEQG